MSKTFVMYYWVQDYGDGESYPQFHTCKHEAEKECKKHVKEQGYGSCEIFEMLFEVNECTEDSSLFYKTTEVVKKKSVDRFDELGEVL